MKNDVWIPVAEACRLLGVRPQTLYAYVSRNMLRARKDADDARRSLYAQADVIALVQQNKRPRARREVAARAIQWGEPVLDTAISGVRDGVLYFGAQAAVDCARDMTLEQVAAHHWQTGTLPSAPPLAELPQGDTALIRGLSYLSGQSGTGPVIADQTRTALAHDGARLMQGATSAILGTHSAAPAHLHLAKVWDVNAADADILRQALVLMSDHELNPSSFAARVCASTAPTLAACLLAAFATLSGARHGGVASNTAAALDAACAGPTQIERFLKQNAASAPYAYGYGHPLYPKGDPRAAHLLGLLPQDALAVRAVYAFGRRVDTPPNIDSALAACSTVLGLPSEAGFILFAIGRMAGWIAHAIEQNETDQLIRPRARFVPLA